MKVSINPIKFFRNSLVFKLILTIDVTLLLSIGIWAYFSIEYQGVITLAASLFLVTAAIIFVFVFTKHLLLSTVHLCKKYRFLCHMDDIKNALFNKVKLLHIFDNSLSIYVCV